MAELVANCPRCGAVNITFDLLASRFLEEEYGWQGWWEAYSACRNCFRTAVFLLRQKEYEHTGYLRKTSLSNVTGSLNNYFAVEGFVSLKDFVREKPPEHVLPEIEAAFKEGATCLAVNCFNAAGTMFRLCIDHATRSLVPDTDKGGPEANVRRSLGLRLNWLFTNKILPENLKELSHCIKEDGNDGAHAGTLTKEDADDLLDFTKVLLERLYTEPKELELAKVRREERRKPKSKS